MPNNEVNDVLTNKVMTFAEVAEAAGVSLSTLRREIARGSGPEVVSLSPRRKGIRSDCYHRWLDTRTNAARGTA
jgi:hypothetical protein